MTDTSTDRPSLPPSVDVIVVGSGAAALTAAITAHDNGARVAVVERTTSIGGTTAVSGGGIWMPQNHHMATLGIDDSRPEALAYMVRLTAGRTPIELLECYVDEGPGIVADLEKRTRLRLQPMSWPDYHPEMEGAKSSGRMLEPDLFDTTALGRWADTLRRPPCSACRSRCRRPPSSGSRRYYPERFDAAEVQQRIADHRVACGQALIAALLDACLTRGIEPVLDARACEVAMQGDRVVGMVVDHGGRRTEVPAPSVVLATGGYEWNASCAPAFWPVR